MSEHLIVWIARETAGSDQPAAAVRRGRRAMGRDPSGSLCQPGRGRARPRGGRMVLGPRDRRGMEGPDHSELPTLRNAGQVADLSRVARDC